jgi:tripartite-type tricarboxylate transporter receptor subunit TctC
LTSGALANDYPNRPITIVVAYAAGGSNDVVARLIGPKVSDFLGKPVVIENVSGGGGEVGASRVARSAPDGYTLFLAAGGHAIAHGLKKTLQYDLVKDFSPISQVVQSPYMLLTNPSLPVKSVEELIAYAKKHPGELNYSSSGTGNPPHLCAEVFQKMTGTELVQVPYRGEQPAIAGLVAGDVQMSFQGPGSTKGFIDSGTIRALAVTSKSRLKILPDVPTLQESGLANFDISTWFALIAPKNVDADVVKKLHEAVLFALKDPTVLQRLAELGMVPVGNSPDELGALLKTEVARYEGIIRAAGIERQ